MEKMNGMKKLLPLALVLAFLFGAGIAEGAMRASQFLELCKSGTHQEVMSAVQARADVRAKDRDGKTALMLAAQYNSDPQVITVLVQARADVRAKDRGGRTALYYAERNDALKGNEEAIRLLGGTVAARAATDDQAGQLVDTPADNREPLPAKRKEVAPISDDEAVFAKLESEETSIHEKIGVYRERSYILSNRKKEQARDHIKKALDNSLPWREGDLSVKDIEYLRNQGYMNSEVSGRQKKPKPITSAQAMAWVFERWIKSFDLAETADEQLRGLKNFYLLSKSSGVVPKLKGGGPFLFKGDIVQLSSELKDTPTVTKDTKFLIISKVGPESKTQIEAGCMLQILSPEAIPESEDEVDVIIHVIPDSSSTTSSGTSGGGGGFSVSVGISVPYEGSLDIRAYDYRSGQLLKEVKNVSTPRVIIPILATPRLIEEKRILERMKNFIAAMVSAG